MENCRLNAVKFCFPVSKPAKKPSGAPAVSFGVLSFSGKEQAYYGRDLVVSFGKNKKETEFKELSDKDFDKFKQKIETKLQTLPENVSKKIKPEKLTKINIFVADKILSDEKIYNNKGFMQRASKIIRTSKSKNIAEGRISVLDKFIKDERIYSRDIFQKALPGITVETYSKESAEAKSDLLDKIISRQELLKDKNFMKNAPDIIKYTSTKDCAKARISIIDKVLSAEKPFCNKHFFNYLPEIIKNTYSSDTADRKIKILDNILSNSELSDNENYTVLTGKLLASARQDYQLDVAEKFLSEKRIYNDEYFTDKNAAFYTEHTNSKENADEIIKTVDFLLSDERFHERKNFGMTLSNILVLNITVGKADIRSLTNKILSNDKLCANDNFMYNIGDFVTHAAYSKIPNTAAKIMDSPENTLKSTDSQYLKMLENPELYVNGNYSNKENEQKAVKEFFENNYYNLLITSQVFDEKTVNHILRMRFESASDYMKAIAEETSQENIDILESLQSASKPNGKALTPGEKVDFLYVLKAYDNLNTDKTPIKEMIKENQVDIYKINSVLYEKLLEKCGFTKEEAVSAAEKESLSFNKKYIHLLTEEVRKANSKGDSAFKDIIKTAASDIDFKTYISDTSNKYGKVNKKTEEIFKTCGLNYEAWMNPAPEDYVHFDYIDNNSRKLAQFSSLIEDDIETLRQTPAKKLIDKKFSNFIKNDRFAVPAEISNNKEKLENFVKNCLTQFDFLFKRAEKNINNPDKKETATKALTVMTHLKQHSSDIEKIDISSGEKTQKYDLTIKMWDRIPQKDIFQGNYSTCCIGMNEFNAGVMPHYLLDGAFNMIEIKDDFSGEIIGNALCYFVKDKSNRPLFIIDNIEIRNDAKPSEQAGIELRNAITEYSSKAVERVTGRTDTPIYMSTHYNDVSTKDLPCVYKDVNFIGKIDDNETYLDLYNGFIWDLDETENVKMLRLK